jgi:hypothetical protein
MSELEILTEPMRYGALALQISGQLFVALMGRETPLLRSQGHGWCRDWRVASTLCGFSRVAIGSMLLRSPGNSKPLQ